MRKQRRATLPTLGCSAIAQLQKKKYSDQERPWPRKVNGGNVEAIKFRVYVPPSHAPVEVRTEVVNKRRRNQW
jgi:hypothetical protein